MKRALPFAIALVIILVAWIQTSNGDKKADEVWMTDMNAALARAKAENKDLLVDFTGSDWCEGCILLEQHVFTKPRFLATQRDFVLVKLDFPNDKSTTTPQQQEKNWQWRNKFAVPSLPSVYLVDPQGRPYGVQSGYAPAGGLDWFMQSIDEIKKVRAQRDAALAKARNAKGAERAKLLDRALKTMDGEFVVPTYRQEVEQIIALDSNNKVGLRKSYEFELATFDAREKLAEIQQVANAMYTEYGSPDVVEYLKSQLTTAGDNAPVRRQLQTLLAIFLPDVKEFDQALEIVQQLVDDEYTTDEERIEFLARQGMILTEAGRNEEAVKHFDELLPQVEHPGMKAGICFSKGQLLDAMGKKEEALATFDTMVKLGQSGSEAWVLGQKYRANLLAELKRHEDAVGTYDLILKMDRLSAAGRIDIMSNKAVAQSDGGMKEEAEATAKNVKALANTLPPQVHQQKWYRDAQKRINAVLVE